MHTADNALSRCLSIDLEVSRQDHRIYALAGTRADTGQSVLWADKSRSDDQADRRVTDLEGDDVVGVKEGVAVEEALAALDELAADADFVVGHNIIEFDLPHLQANAPGLGLLAMPVVDTLWLNPLAFPGQPVPPSRQALQGSAAQTLPAQRSIPRRPAGASGVQGPAAEADRGAGGDGGGLALAVNEPRRSWL